MHFAVFRSRYRNRNGIERKPDVEGGVMRVSCCKGFSDTFACQADAARRLEALAEAEAAEIREFFLQHRCPSEDAIMKWLGKGGKRLLARAGSGDFNLDSFDYTSFKQLWETYMLEPAEARPLRREIGETLHRAGGFLTMQMHYYVLQFALCTGAFIESDQVSNCVVSAPRDLEHDWHGIGEWLE